MTGNGNELLKENNKIKLYRAYASDSDGGRTNDNLYFINRELAIDYFIREFTKIYIKDRWIRKWCPSPKKARDLLLSGEEDIKEGGSVYSIKIIGNEKDFERIKKDKKVYMAYGHYAEYIMDHCYPYEARLATDDKFATKELVTEYILLEHSNYRDGVDSEGKTKEDVRKELMENGVIVEDGEEREFIKEFPVITTVNELNKWYKERKK